jgi:hypothetical protein
LLIAHESQKNFLKNCAKFFSHSVRVAQAIFCFALINVAVAGRVMSRTRKKKKKEKKKDKIAHAIHFFPFRGFFRAFTILLTFLVTMSEI